MTRLAAFIAALRATRGACACPDPPGPHDHYSPYRPQPLRARVAAARAASRKPDPVEAEIDKAIANVNGAAGPSDTEIIRAINDHYKQNGGRG